MNDLKIKWLVNYFSEDSNGYLQGEFQLVNDLELAKLLMDEYIIVYKIMRCDEG